MTELSVEARALIERVGLADGPSAERRARVKRRLVAALVTTGAGIGGVTSAAAASAHAGAAGVALGTATASKGALTVGSIAVWLAAGAGLGTLVSAPALVTRLKAAEHPAVAAAPVVRPVAAPHTAAALVRAPAAVATPLVQAPQAEPQRAPAVKAQEVTLAPAASPAASLADETRVLANARGALAAGRAGAALALLDEHARRFPSGALAEERSAVQVLSLCALGRVEEAKQVADAFVSRAPRSPLLPRLRGSCASAGDDSNSNSASR
jgi:hypothetical protein